MLLEVLGIKILLLLLLLFPRAFKTPILFKLI